MSDSTNGTNPPPEISLARMLATLRATREPGVFVYATVPDPAAARTLPARAIIDEREATTVVLRRDHAIDRGLFFDFECAWLTLSVHSALAAVGLTAAVSEALAAAGIPCNVLAGFHHDHLLVPEDEVDRALAAIDTLRGRSA